MSSSFSKVYLGSSTKPAHPRKGNGAQTNVSRITLSQNQTRTTNDEYEICWFAK